MMMIIIMRMMMMMIIIIIIIIIIILSTRPVGGRQVDARCVPRRGPAAAHERARRGPSVLTTMVFGWGPFWGSREASHT